MPYISKKQLKTLRQVRNIATTETASFGSIGEHVVPGFMTPEGFHAYTHRAAAPMASSDYIRDRTRLWRTTWVVGPLDALLADLEKDL